MKTINLEKIRNKRIQLNLSLQYVSEELGFKNASTYLKYETGIYSFRADMLPILAKVLEMEIENFFEK